MQTEMARLKEEDPDMRHQDRSARPLRSFTAWRAAFNLCLHSVAQVQAGHLELEDSED